MKTKDHPGANRSTRMEAPKHAGRKTVPHRATITKHDNGGYTVEMQHKYQDAKDEFGDRPAPVSAAFDSHEKMASALPEMFDEEHPSTKPAKRAEGQESEEEVPE